MASIDPRETAGNGRTIGNVGNGFDSDVERERIWARLHIQPERKQLCWLSIWKQEAPLELIRD